MLDVKKMRESHGWTQQELADACGVSLRTVQSWEAGKAVSKRQMRLLNAIDSPDAPVITQISHGDHFTNFKNSKVEQPTLLGKALDEIAAMRKAFTDALADQQKITNRLLTIIESRGK